MKKHVNLLALLVMLIFSVIISGCGNSDKFSGTWVSVDGGQMEILNIKKNGESYLLDKKDFFYEYERINVKTHGWEAVFDLKEILKQKDTKAQSVTANGEKLIVDGTMGTEFFTYNQEKKTLLYKNSEFKKTDKGLRDIVKENLQTLKEQTEKSARAKSDKYDTVKDITYDDSILDTLQ